MDECRLEQPVWDINYHLLVTTCTGRGAIQPKRLHAETSTAVAAV